MYECQHVTSIINTYSKKNTTINYERHKGVTVSVELDEERTIKFHAMVIKLAEEQRFAIEEVDNETMPPMEAAFARLQAPKSPDNASAIDASFEEANRPVVPSSNEEIPF